MGGGASKKAKSKPSEPVGMTLAMHTELGIINLKLRRSFEPVSQLFSMNHLVFPCISLQKSGGKQLL